MKYKIVEYVTSMVLCTALLLCGCSYGLVRKAWCVQSDPMGIAVGENEFSALMEKTCNELGLVLRDRYIFSTGEPSPLLFTERQGGSLVPSWMMVSFDTEKNCILVSFDRGLLARNEPIFEEVSVRIRNIMDAQFEGRYPIEVQFDDNFRMPSDII